MMINSLNTAMDTAQIESLRQQSNRDVQDKAKLKQTAQDFESIFIEQMFKEMKKTINRSGFMGETSQAYEIFDGMLAQEYAKTAAKGGGFGLAKMIEDSLTPQPKHRFYDN